MAVNGMPGVRPLLIVDIDGVLNPYAGPCPEGCTEQPLFGDDEIVRTCVRHAVWLRELATTYDLAWGTSWSAGERALLATVLDLPPFTGAVEMPPTPFDPALKVTAIERFASGRPLAWVDDLLGPAAWAWAQSRPAPTLLIPVDPATGLAETHVRQLWAWAGDPGLGVPPP
jgi:hypothetical protein